ncbi:MAG: hypothetical protein QXS89_05980 [Sulfolobales archaeon]
MSWIKERGILQSTAILLMLAVIGAALAMWSDMEDEESIHSKCSCRLSFYLVLHILRFFGILRRFYEEF